MRTKFIVVRHGEAEGNILRIFHGHHDSFLTDDGHIQAEKAAQYLKDYEIDHIYSSDLTRTYSTAEHIAKIKNLKIKKIPGLREIFGGSWENVAWAKLPDLYPDIYNFWENDISKAALPKGESVFQMFLRVKSTFEELAKKHSGETVCVVTHGTVIRAMLCLWRGLPISKMQTVPWFDNASITIIDYIDNNNYELVSEGINSHLKGISTFEKQDWWQRYDDIQK